MTHCNCFPPSAGLGQNASLARQTAPVWGTFALLCVLVLPPFFWLLYRERQEDKRS